MKRLRDVRPHYERVPADRLPPDEGAIAALQRVDDDALLRERERWRPVLERILALSDELHPGTRYGLKAEAERLWQRLELGALPAIPKTERLYGSGSPSSTVDEPARNRDVGSY
ncbi:MAG: hypothetical protein C5B58_01920 [Acidobacteria bacterium]|nr:MAG: hypothetical protein C5B58_01920 [Acidobacteriota bacterium]